MGNIKFEAALGKDDLVQMDRYICKGAAVETFTPHFTYHGFQYVLVTGIRADQALPDLLTYLVRIRIWKNEEDLPALTKQPIVSRK